MSQHLPALLRHVRRNLLMLGLVPALFAGMVLVPQTTVAGAVRVPAAPARVTTADVHLSALSKPRVKRVLRVAASKKGTPYRYGAVGPRAFDCSGFTRWVFKRVGKHLPRTSRAQYGATRHLKRSHRHRGDLVFFHSGGSVYHVAIYAGKNRIWHAPSTGQRVKRERLWTNKVWYGRVR